MARIELTFSWAGRTWTFGDHLIGTEWTQTLPIASGGGADLASVSVTLDLGVDVAALVAAGHDLAQATGTLTLDDVVVLVGRAIGPTYGDPSEPPGVVRLTIRQSVIDDTSLWPPPGLVIDTTTWPNAPDSVKGRVYPQVWGAPASDDSCAGSPALLVEYTISGGHQYLLVHGASAGGVTAVRIISITAALAADFTIIHMTDGRGQQVAVVDLEENAAPFGVSGDGDEFWCMWDAGQPRSGLAGDVVADMLALMAIKTDAGRVAAAIPALNAYSLAFYIDERINPREWLTAHLIDILPIVLVRDAGGLYPAVWRAAVTTADAVAHLVIGRPDCIATSAISYTGDPLNSFTLRYKLRADTGDMLSVVTADSTNHYYAELSLNRYRGDAHDGRWEAELETSVVYDVATAERIAHERVRRLALSRRQLEVWCDRQVWSHIRPGDLVRLTDSARSLSEALAWVETRADDEDGMRLTLTLQEDPIL